LTAERAAGHDVTALIVDDDVHLRALLAEVLEGEGFDVSTASNGFSALRLAGERRPRLVLLDVVLPELSGGEVLEELRASSATRDIAVVMVTGNPQRLTDAQLADVDGLVRKPFDVPELLAAVHRAFQHATARHAASVAPASTVSHRHAERSHRPPARQGRGRHP
jgi:DNA-binding response OmpR family regulator